MGTSNSYGQPPPYGGSNNPGAQLAPNLPPHVLAQIPALAAQAQGQTTAPPPGTGTSGSAAKPPMTPLSSAIGPPNGNTAPPSAPPGPSIPGTPGSPPQPNPQALAAALAAYKSQGAV